MMPTPVNAHLTSDGKLFTSEREALIHEATVDLRQYINGLGNAGQRMDAEWFVSYARQHPGFAVALRALLAVL